MPRPRSTPPTATFLDAIIWFESQGKTQTTSAHAATESAPADEPSAEMVAAQAAYEKSSEKTDFSKKMDSVWEYLKKLFRLSLDTKFIATRRDAIILNIPHPDSPSSPCLPGAPRYG